MKLLIAGALTLFATSYVFCSESSFPDGYLLAFNVVEDSSLESDNVSLFRIDLNGTTSHLWDISLYKSDRLYFQNLFAIDTSNNLVYVGVRNKLLSLDLSKGSIRTKRQLGTNCEGSGFICRNDFLNYDYITKHKTILGICSGAFEWNWCRIDTKLNPPLIDHVYYSLPYADVIGPSNYIYFLDQDEQSLWYYPGSSTYPQPPKFAVGINYTNGSQIFKSASNPVHSEDVCIIRDHAKSRVFTLIRDHKKLTALGIGELFPQPQPRKILVDFSKEDEDKFITSYGSCTYDESSRTLIGFISNTTEGVSEILLVNLEELSYKTIPLQGFPNSKPIALRKIKFIQN